MLPPASGGGCSRGATGHGWGADSIEGATTVSHGAASCGPAGRLLNARIARRTPVDRRRRHRDRPRRLAPLRNHRGCPPAGRGLRPGARCARHRVRAGDEGAGVQPLRLRPGRIRQGDHRGDVPPSTRRERAPAAGLGLRAQLRGHGPSAGDLPACRTRPHLREQREARPGDRASGDHRGLRLRLVCADAPGAGRTGGA